MKIKRFLLFYIFLFLVSCRNNVSLKKELNEQSISTIKKNTTEYEWKLNLYRSFKHEFKVEFPLDWKYEQGKSPNTLAISTLQKNYSAISVLVIELPVNVKSPNDITKSINQNDFKNEFITLSRKQNITPNNLLITKGYLNNFPAYIIKFNSKVKSYENEYTYYSEQVKCFRENKIYQISLNLPIELYDEYIKSEFTKTINSFNFLNSNHKCNFTI